jgi:hypothetical protein
MPDWNEHNPHTPPEAKRDPSFELIAASDFADYRDEDGNVPEWFPVILELGVSAHDFVRGDWIGVPPAGWRTWIRVPGSYRRPPYGTREFRFCTATVRRAFFDAIRLPGALRNTVARFELCMPLNRETDTAPPPTAMFPRRFDLPDAVVTGVIDDGLAFAHEQFRLAWSQTRVENFWDQDAILPPGTLPPPGFGYGREAFKRVHFGVPGIDAHIAKATHAGLVDEDQVYARIGGLDYSRSGHKALGRRIAHGTHAMHAACKVDRPGDLPDRPIVCVQLPSRSVADTSGTSLARHILDGLMYILRRADRIARERRTDPLPVVVNVSFGNIAGPHDGTSILEAAMDQLIQLRQAGVPPAPLAIVLPAGNAHLSRCQARFGLSATGETESLAWRVQPDDATPSNLQIYARRRRARAGDVPPRIAIRITPPSGLASPWIELGETFTWREGPWVLCAATNLPAISTGGSAVAQIWLAPTVTQHATRVVARSGLWRIEVRRRSGGRPFDVWAWIQRDDRPFGYPVRGRQSRFEDARYVYRHPVTGRHEEEDLDPSAMKRGGLMNAFATGRRTIAIGGFRQTAWREWKRSWQAWERSAGGPLPRGRRGPDALAISEDSDAGHGRLAAGTRSGRLVAMNGSSVAAPQVANFLVDEAAAGRPINRAAVRKEAARQESPSPPRPPLPKPPRGGFGRIVRRPLQRVRRI